MMEFRAQVLFTEDLANPFLESKCFLSPREIVLEEVDDISL